MDRGQFGPAVVAEAKELVGCVDRLDFLDAIDVAISHVNEWAPEASKVSHRSFHESEVEALLGAGPAAKYFAAMKVINGGRARKDTGPIPRADYLAPLYDERLMPSVRLRMCHFLHGFVAHLTLVYALDRGLALSPAAREGIGDALERAAVAIQQLEALRK